MSDRRVFGFLALAAACIIGVFLHAPIPQPENYHHFADTRTIFGIPNAWNVLSNLGFLVVGVWGTIVAARARLGHAARIAYLVLFVGVLTTAFGSTYYHWSPSNSSLFWDRMPMTLGFMGLFAAVIGERLGEQWTRLLLMPLVALGLVSVSWWYWTETLGRGDLRLYLLVQFFPLIGILYLMAAFPARYSKGYLLVVAMALYALAKFFEGFDHQTYAAIGFGGHALKHLFAAAATAKLAWMLATRSPIHAVYSESGATVDNARGV